MSMRHVSDTIWLLSYVYASRVCQLGMPAGDDCQNVRQCVERILAANAQGCRTAACVVCVALRQRLAFAKRCNWLEHVTG